MSACFRLIGGLEFQFNSFADAQSLDTIHTETGRGCPGGLTGWIEHRWAQVHENAGLVTRHGLRAAIVKY